MQPPPHRVHRSRRFPDVPFASSLPSPFPGYADFPRYLSDCAPLSSFPSTAARKWKRNGKEKGEQGREPSSLYFFSSRRRGSTRNEFITSDTRRSLQPNSSILIFAPWSTLPAWRALVASRAAPHRTPHRALASLLPSNIPEFMARRGDANGASVPALRGQG